MDTERLLIRAPKRIMDATTADIERARTDPIARALVLETYVALRRFMQLCQVEPTER